MGGVGDESGGTAVKAPLSESPLRPLVRALGERGGGGSTNEGQSGVRRRRETGERERGVNGQRQRSKRSGRSQPELQHSP